MSSLFGKSKRKRTSSSVNKKNAQHDDTSTSTEQENEKNLVLTTSKEQQIEIEIENSTSKSSSYPNKYNYSDNDNDNDKNDNNNPPAIINTFSDLKLAKPLLQTCAALGFKVPTPIQKAVIPFLIHNSNSSSSRQDEPHNVLALSSTGSGKTAAFTLPILHHLSHDPYGIYAVILSPTRELAQQIHQQVLALGSNLNVKSALVIGGMDMTRQSCELSHKPHVVVGTPGRLGSILRGPIPPNFGNVRFVVLDEADRLLASSTITNTNTNTNTNTDSSGKSKSKKKKGGKKKGYGCGFEKDVAEILLAIHKNRQSANENSVQRRKEPCQTLLFSATLTKSLESIEDMVNCGMNSLPFRKFVIDQDHVDDSDDDTSDNDDDYGNSDSNDNDDDSSENEDGPKTKKMKSNKAEKSSIPKIPAGLKQEYVFMPSHVRDTYLVTIIRHLMVNGGRKGSGGHRGKGGRDAAASIHNMDDNNDEEVVEEERPDASGWNDTTTITSSSEQTNHKSNKKAKSAIIFVSTCERTALLSGILTELGVSNVPLHSLLSQNRRLASLGKFKSQQVRVLVATDVASRGLDIPNVDLVVNCDLPRKAVDYIHRVGRTARAGRRGRAVSLVGERDVSLVHACESMAGRVMDKCEEVGDDEAVKL